MSEVSQSSFPFYLKADLVDAEERLNELLRKLPATNEEDLQLSTNVLQTLVHAIMPDLWELGQTIAQLLRNDVPAIVVQALPFSCVDLNKSKLAMLAFASCIGEPGVVDPYSRKRVWEVSPRVEANQSYVPTITEHNCEADLHTDSSFKQTPEEYVLFFAFHPASDGGGVSTLLSADQLLGRLFQDDEGRECARLLNTIDWPFRVPTVFTRRRSEAEMEWITAPILSSKPRIRFRYDVIASALEHIPITPSSEAQWALSHFLQILKEITPISYPLAQDELLVLDNCVVLHGRTAFDDLDRMLLRVRLSNL